MSRLGRGKILKLWANDSDVRLQTRKLLCSFEKAELKNNNNNKVFC